MHIRSDLTLGAVGGIARHGNAHGNLVVAIFEHEHSKDVRNLHGLAPREGTVVPGNEDVPWIAIRTVVPSAAHLTIILGPKEEPFRAVFKDHRMVGVSHNVIQNVLHWNVFFCTGRDMA